MSYIVGVDLGSTSLKANIYDPEGNLVSAGSNPTEVSNLDPDHPSWAFWEPDKLWSDTASAIRKAVEQLDKPERIEGIAVTGFGMDGLPVNGSGEWLYPFISWHCDRTEPQFQRWTDEIGSEEIFSTTGKQPMPIDTVYRLLWMKENKPNIMKKTEKWLLVEDFINFNLCGKMATDYSMASSTSLLNQNAQSWDSDLIQKVGIDEDLLPELLPSGTPLGQVTSKASDATGLPEDATVILGGHDYLCAALSAGAFKPGVILDIGGTWEIVLQSSLEPQLTTEVFESGLTVDSHVKEDIYATVGTAVSAEMLEWFRENFFGKDVISEKEGDGNTTWKELMDQVKESPIGSKGVCFLPHFSGAGTPINDSRSSGAFVGLNSSIQKKDMLRSLLEGLNYQFREMVEGLEKALGIKADTIVAVGGTTKNEFWMQNKANVAGREIEVPNIKEATALGAALLSGIGIGLFDNAQKAHAKVFERGEFYKPNKEKKETYDHYYSDIYKQVYPSIKELNWKIFEEFRT